LKTQFLEAHIVVKIVLKKRKEDSSVTQSLVSKLVLKITKLEDL
jgi:hypothetical protein